MWQPSWLEPCSRRAEWGTHTVSLCSAHKALHKGHKAGQEERAVTPARALCSPSLPRGQARLGSFMVASEASWLPVHLQHMW